VKCEVPPAATLNVWSSSFWLNPAVQVNVKGDSGGGGGGGDVGGGGGGGGGAGDGGAATTVPTRRPSARTR